MRRFRTISTLALGICMAVAATASAQTDKAVARERGASAKWALLVGVNDYLNVTPLKYSVADIHALRKQLVATGFAQDHVFTLADDGADVRRRPLKKNIDRHLNALLGTLDDSGENLAAQGLVEAGDLVVVAFSGHGVHLDGTSYLCPTDTDLDETTTLLSVERIYKQLELSGATVKLVIVDACRNDPRQGGDKAFERRAEGRSLVADFGSPPSGILVLSSCAPGQRSWEDNALSHGVFMNFVVDGLGGAADQYKGNRDNQVSLLELYSYAADKTKSHVAGMIRDGIADGAQTPRLKGEIEGDFNFGGTTPVSLPDRVTAPATTAPVAPVRPARSPVTIKNTVGMELVMIPRGEFVMGSNDRDAYADEAPAHRVRLTHNFYLARHEVTVGQFSQFVYATNYKTESQRDGRGGAGWCPIAETFVQNNEYYNWDYNGYEMNDNQPVVNVSWNDAVAFCEWLSKKEGTLYHLPSEAQWEYACRAGSTSRFSFGDDPEKLASYGNIADGTASERFHWPESIHSRDGYVFMSPVGSFKPNAWGLYDMHGNVQEWCGDAYGERYYQQFNARTAENPTGVPSQTATKVIRGGSWAFEAKLARSTQRYSRPANTREDRIGFRVARMP